MMPFIRQIIRVILVIYGLFFLIPGITGLLMVHQNMQYPEHELKMTPAQYNQTFSFMAVVGSSMLFIALFWWYKELKKK